MQWIEDIAVVAMRWSVLRA